MSATVAKLQIAELTKSLARSGIAMLRLYRALGGANAGAAVERRPRSSAAAAASATRAPHISLGGGGSEAAAAADDACSCVTHAVLGVPLPNFEALPRELIVHTLAYLDVTSLCQMAQVSKGFGRLADDGAVWREACGRCKEHQRARCLHQQMLEAEERERREQARRRRWRKWMRRSPARCTPRAAPPSSSPSSRLPSRRAGAAAAAATPRSARRAAERRGASAVENIIASACGLGAKAELRGAR